MRRWLCVFTLIGILLSPAVAQKTLTPAPGPMALQVRSEFLYAWNAYKQYAWGHDELTPLSKGYHDWHSKSLLMTPVDALDTMLIMGLTDEADKTREFIATNLSFDQDIEVKNFEITIRLLGGLLSSYQMTGDKRLLDLADDSTSGESRGPDGVPDGTTVMDIVSPFAQQSADGEAKAEGKDKPAGKQPDKKKEIGNSSEAAQKILQKYMRRQRT